MRLRAAVVVSVCLAPFLVGLAAVPVPASPLPAPGPGTYVPLASVRVLDTRIGLGTAQSSVAGGHEVSVTVAGTGDVPATGVSAVVLNLTVTHPSAAGYLTAFAAGTTRPGTSNLLFVKGETIAALANVTVGASGQVTLFNGSTGSVSVVADLQGYFVDGTPTDPGAYVTLSPARVLDTRTGTGGPRAALAAGASRQLTLTGHGGVPGSNVSAVVLSLTVTAATAAGYVSALPAGGPAPNPPTSNLNHAKAETVANLVVVAVGTGGQITLHNGSVGTIQLVADVAGYYLGGATAADGAYTSLVPARVLDTAHGIGAAKAPLVSGHTIALGLGGQGGVPRTGVSAVVLNLTVAGATGPGYLTTYTHGSPPPATSVINFSSGQTIANLVVVKVGADGVVDLHDGGPGSARVIADVAGYYVGGASRMSWTTPTSIELDHTMHGVSCATTTFCAAVDDGGFASTWDGAHWSALTSASPRQLEAMSCPTTTFCMAVGAYTAYATFDGSQWTAGTIAPPAVGGLVSVSCVSPTFCVAVGNTDAYVFNGTMWSSPTDLNLGPTVVSGVSCATTTFCVAVDETGDVVPFDGAIWSAPTDIDGYRAITSVACPSTTRCLVVDGTGHLVTYDGTGWSTPIQLEDSYLKNLSCASVSFCGLIDLDGNALTFDGSLWSAPTLINQLQQMQSISCPLPQFCVTVDVQANAVVGSTT